MHTLNIASDVEYGQQIPPPFNIRPQLPCHSPAESLKPSNEVSFAFLARRRCLYKYIAQNLEMLTPPVNTTESSRQRMRAHSAMLALNTWRPAEGAATLASVPQLDQAARLAGLLYYRLVYMGGKHDVETDFMSTQLQSECTRLHDEQHILSSLYQGCSNRLCLILWICYCGGTFAAGELRAWYAHRISIIAGNTGKDWGCTKEILRRFAWDDEACEGPMKQLWRESQGETDTDVQRGALCIG